MERIPDHYSLSVLKANVQSRVARKRQNLTLLPLNFIKSAMKNDELLTLMVAWNYYVFNPLSIYLKILYLSKVLQLLFLQTSYQDYGDMHHN